MEKYREIKWNKEIQIERERNNEKNKYDNPLENPLSNSFTEDRSIRPEMSACKLIVLIALGVLLANFISFVAGLAFTNAVLKDIGDALQKATKNYQQTSYSVQNNPISKMIIQPAQGEGDAIKNAQQRAEKTARDLQQEQAFKAEYKKPTECYNMQNHETRIVCGNHYIRARSDFAKKFATAQQQITDKKFTAPIVPKLNITIKNDSYNIANCGVMRENKFVNFLQLNGKQEKNYKDIEKPELIGCQIKIHYNKNKTFITWFDAVSSGVYTLLYEKIECKTCTGINHTWATIVIKPNGERIYQPA